MAWSSPIEELRKKDIGAWIIVSSSSDLNVDSIRFGLSLLALKVQAEKGQGFPIILILTDKAEPEKNLPTPLAGADIMSLATPSLTVKIVASTGSPQKTIQKDYHIDVHPLAGLGLWVEVGPNEGIEWKGAFFGVKGGEVDFHAVGPRGFLPDRCVVEYPQKGIKVEVGNDLFVAWALRNNIDGKSSYFLRVTGMPEKFIFGPYPEEDTAEMNILTLY